jgi:hypothetical protein
MNVAGKLSDRFWLKVDHRGPYACWPWLGGKDKDGYGKAGGRLAHRIAYELECGLIPPGLQIDHLCRNRACQNPAHMETVTSRVNTLRGISPSACAARRTSCIHGHVFDATNTYTKSGKRKRECRECNRAAVRRYQRGPKYRARADRAEGATP